jgi:uncharacterized membrane protein YraQ (UPF0718 family)
MKKNIGTHDANMRMVAGVFIIVFALFLVDQYVIRIILAVIAAILAGTAFLHTCPLYVILGKDTCEVGSEDTSLPTEKNSEDETKETEDKIQ